MRILTSLVIVATLLFSSSCGNSKKIKNNKENTVEESMQTTPSLSDYPNYAVDYLAAAEDKSWYVSVEFEDQVIFYDRKNNIEFSALESTVEVATGTNNVHVWAENAVYKIHVIISDIDCGEHGKQVDITLSYINKKKEFNYAGCGLYRGKPQLHDIWALVELNGEKLNPEQFPREFPHFEFDLAQQKMSGFAGCNYVNGKIYFGYRNIIIEPLISTKMYCGESSTVENEVLKILRNKPTYHIKDLKLYIETTEGSLVLKKVD